MVGGVRGSGAVDPTDLRNRHPTGAPTEGGETRSLQDRVTLSSAARASHIPDKLRALSAQAHSDPKLAEQLAYDYAHTEQSAIIDLSDLEAGRGPAKYAATGEPVTPESEQQLKQMSQSLRATTAALYDTGKANGTPAADVFDKLLSMIGSQPAEFRTLIGWGN